MPSATCTVPRIAFLPPLRTVNLQYRVSVVPGNPELFPRGKVAVLVDSAVPLASMGSTVTSTARLPTFVTRQTVDVLSPARI